MADKSKKFVSNPDVYHWHPVAFLEQMREMEGFFIFPLPKEFRDKGYHDGERAFRSSRENGARTHAGCDLYAPAGTEVYAVADGEVVGYHNYYWKTYALEVNHGDFSVVYGEVQPPSNVHTELPAGERIGLPADVKVGGVVKKGQHIAYVGQLYVNSGPNKFSRTMVHFEKYGNEREGAFTDETSAAADNYIRFKTPSNTFKRRRDLDNPTVFLDGCCDK